MADTTNKTLKVAIQTDTSDSVETLKLVRKELEGTGVAIKTLSSVMGKNEEGNLQYVHSIELVSKSFQDLEKVIERVSKIKTGGIFTPVPASTVSSNLTKDIKETEVQAAKDAIATEKTRAAQATKISADILDKAKASINSQLIAIREGENSIVAIKNASAEKQKQIEAALQEKLKSLRDRYTSGDINKSNLDLGIKSTTEAYKRQTLALAEETDKQVAKVVEAKEKVIAETKRRIELVNSTEREALSKSKANLQEKLAIEREGENSITAVKVAAAEKQRLLENKLQADLKAVRDKFIAGESTYIQQAAARNQYVRNYEDSIIKLNRSTDARIAKIKEEQAAEKEAERLRSMTIPQRFATVPTFTPTSDYKRNMIVGMSAAANPPAAQLLATPPAPDVKPWDSLLTRVLGINAAYRVSNFLINEFISSAKAIPKIGIELESTRAALTASMGESGASIAMEALKKEADRTGMSINALRESFRTFSASTLLSGQGLESTWKMFQNINTTATALHFSTDQVNHTFLALSQIFNKSKVQSEELVKQLGNLLPGAFAAFQKANEDLYSSPKKLSEAMKQGLVTASETVEKFTTYYAERFAVAFQGASEGLNANINRMNNSFTSLGEAIYGVTGGSMNAFVKSVTNITKYLEAAIKGENDFILVTKTMIEVVGVLLVDALVLSTANILKLEKAIKEAIGTMAAAKTTALELGMALKSMAGPAVLAGLAAVVSYTWELGKARRAILDATNDETAALKKNSDARQLYTPLETLAEENPKVIAARKQLEALQGIEAERAKMEQQSATSFTISKKKEGSTETEAVRVSMSEAKKYMAEKIAMQKEQISATLELATTQAAADRELTKKKIGLDTSDPKYIAELEVKALRSKADMYNSLASQATAAKNYEEADRQKTLAEETDFKAKSAQLKLDASDNLAKATNDLRLAEKAKEDAEKQKASGKDVPEAEKLIADADVQIEKYKAAKQLVQDAIKDTETKNESDLATFRLSLAKKQQADDKKAATERQKAIKQDIKADEELNKTIINTAKLQTKALDDEYAKRTITFDDYFNRKQVTLDKEYKAEKEKLLEIQALSKGTGKRGEEEKARQELIRLDENKAAADAQIDRDRKTRTEEYKTQLADIRDQYYQILGVEGGDNEITKEKLRLLRQEIALKAAAGDIASQNALKQFDTTQYNKGLIKDMAVAQQGMDANQNKLNEELARTNALENVGRISSIQGALDRTKANEKYIKSQEKVIQNMEEELSKPSSFEKSNQLTEKLRKAKAELENFKLTADEVSSAVENSLGNAFEKSFTGIIDGSMTATQAFKAFATSIVQDIIKMTASAVRAELLSPLLKMAFSGFAGMAGGLFSSAAPAVAAPTIMAANGGVFSGAGISAYSGSIVNSPTIFPFAAGAGLMGEAGPEAVLPLKRNSQGKLGVSLDKNGQNSAGNVYYINTTVNTNSNASPNEIANKTSEAIIRAIAKQEINSAARPGNALNKVTKYG